MDKKLVSRRDFLRVTSITTAGAALAACAVPAPQVVETVITKEVPVTQVVEKTVEVEKMVTPTPPPAMQPTTIRFNEMGAPWQTWVEKLAVPRFNEEYPWVTIEYEPIDWSTFPVKELTQMAAGTAPDVLHGWSQIFITWASKGQLLNMNPLVESDFSEEAKADQIPFQWDTLVYPFTGERYAIPGYVDQQIVYYNKDAFDKAGIAYPTETWTYDDYAAASKKLNEFDASGNQTGWGGWTWYTSWTFNACRIQAFGGHVSDADTWMTCRLSEPEAKHMIEWVRQRIWDDKSWINDTQVAGVGVSGDSGQLFATGIFKMMEADIEFWQSMAKNVKFKWDVMHVPVGYPDRHSLGDNDAWCIYKGSTDRGPNQVEAAWKWVKFMNDIYFQRLIAFQSGNLPARKSMTLEWPTIVRQILPELEPVKLEVCTDAFDMGYLTPSEQFRYQADAEPIVATALEQIWQTGGAGVEILDQMCADVNKSQQDAYNKEKG
jgi:multiple sugar transport system substrate-binding protein